MSSDYSRQTDIIDIAKGTKKKSCWTCDKEFMNIKKHSKLKGYHDNFKKLSA